MLILWTEKAREDLARLYDFLSVASPAAASRAVLALAKAPCRIAERPRIGEVLEEFSPREVRRILVGPYEMRYEVREGRIYILRVWHAREDR